VIIKRNKVNARKRRHRRVRGKIIGTSLKPRLCVFRSLKHIYAQVIDDTCGNTIASASSIEKDFNFNGGNKIGSKELGKIIADRILKKGIKKVIFDRSGYLYHGRVKEVAEGAREMGLDF